MALIKTEEFSNSDWQMYFQHTIVRVLFPDGKAEWFAYNGTNAEGWHFARNPKEVLKLKKPEVLKIKIDVVFPTGFFNTKTSVVYGERIGTRQNHKGLSVGQNYNLFPIEKILAGAGITGASDEVISGLALGPKYTTLTAELANFLFESQKYLTLSEAYVQIRGKKTFARALSPEFAMVPHHESKEENLIFFGQRPVAELFSKTKIRVLVPAFTRELKNFFEPQGATIVGQKNAA